MLLPCQWDVTARLTAPLRKAMSLFFLQLLGMFPLFSTVCCISEWISFLVLQFLGLPPLIHHGAAGLVNCGEEFHSEKKQWTLDTQELVVHHSDAILPGRPCEVLLPLARSWFCSKGGAPCTGSLSSDWIHRDNEQTIYANKSLTHHLHELSRKPMPLSMINTLEASLLSGSEETTFLSLATVQEVKQSLL